MDNVVYEFEEGHRRLLILYDEFPPNPQTEFSNLGTMVCGHRRYILGNEQVSSAEEMNERIRALPKGSLVLPLYLYDHSGVVMQTRGFSEIDSHGWDWGCVGFVYATPEKIRESYMVKQITKKIRERAQSLLESEVETYSHYLNGEVYGFIAYEDGEEVDSCWGFYGWDWDKNGLTEHLPEEFRPLLH